MRLYLVHRKYYLAYLSAQNAVERIIDEWSQIASKTDPRCTLAEHERDFIATTSLPHNASTIGKAEQYAIEMEQHRIKERLTEAKEILSERVYLLEQKENDLRRSSDLYDKIYLLKWIEHEKPEDIAELVHYSRSQVYNIIGHLSAQLEREENE